MGNVVVSEFISLDGVFEDPGGAEANAFGGWALKPMPGPDQQKFKLDELMAAEAQLLGRVTYEAFAAAWPGREDPVGFADKMNSMPKVVASTTLEDASWENTRIVRGDLAAEIGKLKEETSGDILVAGSGTLVDALGREGLVDEYRLLVFPVVLGAGRRLFGDGTQLGLELASATTLDGRVAALAYHRSRA